jgi:nitronate monooxygenase
VVSSRLDRAVFDALVAELAAPLLVAPMTGASSLALVEAAVASGVAASFPVHNADTIVELDRWLTVLEPAVRRPGRGPVIPNLLVNRGNRRLAEEIACVGAHRVPAVITSVGSPHEVIGPLHEAGVLVLSDVSSMRHVDRALDLGVDGLVLLSAGAGGQTGFANPFAFVRAVRRRWDGPLVLAGGIVDGVSLLAARVLGCDLGYMGTPFLATDEAAISQEWKAAVVSACLDDVVETRELTGLPTTVVRGADGEPSLFVAGHSAGAVDAVVPAARLVARVVAEYAEGRSRLESGLGGLEQRAQVGVGGGLG